ncbi:MAG TPA: hypothetical protein VFS04_13555 [Alphaproteobacteria bacterium]|nr:hypothetical protein [Alphaproteobacteria bacterium]
MLRFGLLAAAGLLLSACQAPQTVIISEITAFHRINPATAAGKTLAIEAFPPERQQSLEFAAYREKLGAAFAAQGLIIVEKAADAEWLAVVNYGIDSGKTEISTYSTPEYGRTGGGTTYQSGTLSSYRSGSSASYSGTSYTPSTYGVVGYSTNTVTTTRYTRTMSIDILDRPALDKGQTVKLYESKLVSSGACGSLAGVFEYMVDGQFANWPGESGKPQKVEVPSPGLCASR